MKPTVLQLKDTVAPDALKQIQEVFDGGGLVVFPTETVYGVGAAVKSDQGMERLRQLKGVKMANRFRCICLMLNPSGSMSMLSVHLH